jgi:hypothetical protein
VRHPVPFVANGIGPLDSAQSLHPMVAAGERRPTFEVGMTGDKAHAVREGHIAAWLSAYKQERPLHSQFPITLKNGKSVPGLLVVCNNCGDHITGDRVRGRIIYLLPHVVTIEANGFCEPCERITHIDCRFRTNGDETLIEWRSSNGLWQAREYRQPTLTEKITKHVRQLLSR